MLKKQKICDLEDITSTIKWKNLKFPTSVAQYTLYRRIIWILDMSLSTSSNILYLLTRYTFNNNCDIYSINITTSMMQQEDCYFSRTISSILCHNQFLYIAEEGPTIYKCVTEGGGLQLVQKWTHLAQYMYPNPALAIGGDGHIHVFERDGDIISFIDSDTMTLLSTKSLQHLANDIAVSKDNKLHVATDNGVHIYTTDGMYTGQSYLDGESCESMTCTSSGYAVIISYCREIAIVSNSLACVCYVNMYQSITVVRYNTANNSLAVAGIDTIVQVPQEVYQPLFSLFSLCMSTIAHEHHVRELPISLLPPRLYKLAKDYIERISIV